MFLTWLSAVLFWFSNVAVVALAGILVWRRLWRELPSFLFYMLSVLLVSSVRYFSVNAGRKAYFYVFWIADLFISLVALLPIYEVFLRRRFAGFQKNAFYRSIFPLATAAILLLTIVTALLANDRGAAFQTASQAFDVMRTSVLIFFIGLILLMGRGWNRYDAGITLGFAIQAAVSLAIAAVRARTHDQPAFTDTIELIGIDLSCVIWLITFWKPERRTKFLSPDQLDPEMLHQARAWERLLKKWLTPGRKKR